MLKIRPENLTRDEMLRVADHELACGRELPVVWQEALVKTLFQLQDELNQPK